MVFISNFGHMFLNLDLPLSSSCSVTLDINASWPCSRVKGGRRRGAAPLAWQQAPAWPLGSEIIQWRALPSHTSSRHWDIGPGWGLALGFKFQSLSRGRRTRTSLSSVVNTTVTGALNNQSGICRRSAHLPTLLMNPRTVSMGSLLEFLTFSSGFTLNYSLDCLFFFCNKHAGWDHYHYYYYFSICYFMISPFLAWSVPDWASPRP